MNFENPEINLEGNQENLDQLKKKLGGQIEELKEGLKSLEKINIDSEKLGNLERKTMSLDDIANEIEGL